ncbi:flavin-dependent monooxygenase [Seongchinamella sediminis]|uniref:Flavin-dependent monooxygenase n=1 Tax=Seongchinamella sediminis TaxID=2283635 RepID=A0A3L7DW71_9GAMM|nr:flavin-dependent monooxygenase [Seongchinamella sediminis]RLQ21025.1 flavin-dependent monooxygenase [Seongchinamella sediminis]
MNAPQQTQAEQLYSAARELVPALRARTAETAALGHLPEATIDAMQQAGFFRIMQPARYGGFELDPEVFFRVQMILAEGCMSTAWVLGVVAIHNWQLALFDDRAQQDVWGEDDSTLISSSYMPVGKVTPVEGGYRLSGHWGFSSGSKHCDWAFLGAVVPPANPGEAPDYRTFLVPRSDYQIVDNWKVSGLEGTGSHDITVEDAFVPEHRTHRSIHGFECNSPGNAVNDHYIFRLPFGQIFVRAVSSSSIGCLKGVIDSYVQVNRDRVGLNDGNKVATDPDAQMALAECIAAVDECQTIMFRNFDRMVAAARAGSLLDIEERIKMRFDAALVSRKCTEAINLMFNACGAQGIFRDHPLNRAWLDINAGRQHVANNPFKFGRNVGGVMMGADNTDFFL